jgi:spermidine/putrescine transport system permease protein
MRKRVGYIYTLPITLWITFFFVIPILIVFVFSFMKKKLNGGIVWNFSFTDLSSLASGHISAFFYKVASHLTFDAYQSLLHPAFLKVVGVTLYIALAATFFTLLLAIPASYYIARSPRKNLLLLLVIVPFWTNLLIRIFAWISILGNNGFVNNILTSLGVITDPIQFLYSKSAVILVTVYTSLPYAILPLYSTIEKFDFTLLEASRDLGASNAQTMWKVFLPNIRVGVITAILFTFIPAIGSYAIPQLIGGTDSYMIGNVIARELTLNRNWPLASSMSLILTVITTIGIYLFVTLNSARIVRQESDVTAAGRSTNG